jgi:thioredoxin 1
MKKILHFTADWCAPCKVLKPIIEDFIKDNPGIEYQQVNVDVDFDIANEYSVMSIPTLVLLVDGDLRARHTGILSTDGLRNFVQ